MPRLIGVALVVSLVGAASSCKKLDTFSDAAPVDARVADAPTDIGLPGDIGPPADTAPDAIPVPATWVTTFGDPATKQFIGEDIGLDASGNIYIGGWLWGVVTIGQTTLGGDEVESQAVVKLDPQGQPVWARQVSPVDMQNASGMFVVPPFNLGFALDPASGSSYVAGTFSNSITIGTTQLTAAGKMSTGNKDVYVAKLDKDGTWLWAVQAGGVEDDIAHDVALTANGPVVVGDFQATASFGSKSLTSRGGPDIFVAQLEHATGAWINALAVGSNSPIVDIGCQYDAETAWAVTSGTGADVYVAGRVYVQANATFGSAGTLSGTFIASADLNPLFGPKWTWARALSRYTWAMLADQTSGDLFAGSGGFVGFTVAEMDGQTGKDKWLFPTSSLSTESYVQGLAQDHVGHIYAGGGFKGTVQLTPDGKNTMTAAGQNDGFVMKLDRHGRLLRTRQIRSTQEVLVYGVAADPSGPVYATGSFDGQATLDGKTVTGQASQRDCFVWKLAP
jgi:hypothetical protein